MFCVFVWFILVCLRWRLRLPPQTKARNALHFEIFAATTFCMHGNFDFGVKVKIDFNEHNQPPSPHNVVQHDPHPQPRSQSASKPTLVALCLVLCGLLRCFSIAETENGKILKGKPPTSSMSLVHHRKATKQSSALSKRQKKKKSL